ncbi:MAG TPA: histidine utilization repressor [Burkholderiaceae bacterium]|nr:histidine utilization repressor [Burkholderiaceae bacterium]
MSVADDSGVAEQTEIPIYQRIKDYLLAEIQAGQWKEGEAIPSEPVLARQFGVSRMTVNRAVRELTSEQILNRIQGSGTYVAQHKYQATLVEIQSIADEIRARAHQHRSKLHLLERCKAQEPLTAQFEVRAGHILFHSIIVHYDNDVPIQVEDRWVNSAVAPDYMQQDFSVSTPNEYLMVAAPLQGVNYSIEALNPPVKIAAMLQIPVQEPCLVLKRKTLSQGQVASTATMWHPGSRYQFAGSL